MIKGTSKGAAFRWNAGLGAFQSGDELVEDRMNQAWGIWNGGTVEPYDDPTWAPNEVRAEIFVAWCRDAGVAIDEGWSLVPELRDQKFEDGDIIG
jgi:hypothetical protein